MDKSIDEIGAIKALLSIFSEDYAGQYDIDGPARLIMVMRLPQEEQFEYISSLKAREQLEFYRRLPEEWKKKFLEGIDSREYSVEPITLAAIKQDSNAFEEIARQLFQRNRFDIWPRGNNHLIAIAMTLLPDDEKKRLMDDFFGIDNVNLLACRYRVATTLPIEDVNSEVNKFYEKKYDILHSIDLFEPLADMLRKRTDIPEDSKSELGRLLGYEGLKQETLTQFIKRQKQMARDTIQNSPTQKATHESHDLDIQALNRWSKRVLYNSEYVANERLSTMIEKEIEEGVQSLIEGMDKDHYYSDNQKKRMRSWYEAATEEAEREANECKARRLMLELKAAKEEYAAKVKKRDGEKAKLEKAKVMEEKNYG